MTLDEAIEYHCEKAEQNEDEANNAVLEGYVYHCEQSYMHHKQYAEWLMELKELRTLVKYAKDTNSTIEKAEIELRAVAEAMKKIERTRKKWI